MRTITVTEKYRAVTEGRLAKSEFVRQMRQKYPMYVSQYDSFDSTVQILKNRNMLYEAKVEKPTAEKVYDDRPERNYSLDALERGIRAELAAMDIMAHMHVKAEDYYKAEAKAKENLDKDCNHYLNLMAGESNNVDKHDREKEVKRGAKDIDTFNGMKKATLKEETQEVVDPNPPMSEDAKKAMLGKVIGVLKSKYKDLVSNNIIRDFLDMHYEDLKDGADIEDEFQAYAEANYQYYTRGIETDPVDYEKELPGIGPDDYESMEEKKGKDHDGDGDIDSDDYMAAKDKAIKKAMGKDESYAMKRMQKAHDQDRRAGKKSTYDQAKEKNKEKQLKEAIKTIIKKSLTENLNEAATNRLSSIGDEYQSFAGAQQVVNQLENIVTEVESFYSKTRDKIQKIYDSMDTIENDEGLKVGVFIGPAIENAFMQDLRPVTKKGFTKDLQLPKAKRLDPEIVAQARAAGEIEEEPKSTVFTPNI